MYHKFAAILFFKLSANRLVLGNQKLPIVIITEGQQNFDLSKLEVWKNLTFWDQGLFFVNLSRFCPGSLNFFGPPTLTGHSFAAPWPSSYDNEKYLIWKPWAIYIYRLLHIQYSSALKLWNLGSNKPYCIWGCKLNATTL